MKIDHAVTPTAAFGYSLLSYFCFSLADGAAKWLLQQYHFSQLIFTANCFGLIFMALYAIRTRGLNQAFVSTKWPLHALRACIMAGNTMLVFFALKHLPLADFYGIIFAGPIWVAILSMLFMHEKIPALRWLAIIWGFSGILLIASPFENKLNIGHLAVIASSFLFAVNMLQARKIGPHEPVTNFSLSVHLAMIAFNAPFLPAHFIMPNLHDACLMLFYACCISLGIFGLGTVFSRFHKPSLIAPVQYTQMIWGVAIGWIVFHEQPEMHVFMGAALVIIAGIIMYKTAHR